MTLSEHSLKTKHKTLSEHFLKTKRKAKTKHKTLSEHFNTLSEHLHKNKA